MVARSKAEVSIFFDIPAGVRDSRCNASAFSRMSKGSAAVVQTERVRSMFSDAEKQPGRGPGGMFRPRGEPAELPVKDSGAVDQLATQIISIVAKRVAGARVPSDPRTDCLDMLTAAAGSADSAVRRDYLRRMQECGASLDEIVDLYIPEAARRMGMDWADDVKSFAEVTIGSARLQAMVRELDRSWQSEQAANSRAPSILMVVQEHDYHTLGTMVAACKFRRLGVSVHMLLGHPDKQVLAVVQAAKFDMVTVSLSSSDRIDDVRKLVKLLKYSGKSVPPIVVGGPVEVTAAEIRSFTGVEHVTSDCAQALNLCGLSVPKPSATLQKAGA